MGKKIFQTILLFTVFTAALSAEPIARVIKSAGNVYLKRVTSDAFDTAVKPGISIDNGDMVRVEQASFAVIIYLDDKSVIKMKENTQFQFVDTENTRTIDMEIGTIINDIKKENRTKTFRVETPTSVASVKGTIFSAMVDASGIDQFYGQEGLFEVFNMVSGQTVAVGPGQKALSSPTGSVISAPAAPSEFPIDPDPDAGTGELEELIEQFTPAEPGQPLPEVQPEPSPEVTPEATETEIPDQTTPESQPSAPSTPSKPFGMGMGVGSVTIDGETYKQFALRPELAFGKLGIGFDLVLYMDNDGNIRKEEWDEAADIIDKFLYVRWAEKGDPFWLKLGALENVTIGFGGLLSGYSNMMQFPSVRTTGFNGGVLFGPVGVELFMANVKDFSRGGTLLGARTSFTVSRNFPLTFGANFVMDVNQFSGLVDSDEDSYPDAFDDFPYDDRMWNDTDGDGRPDPGSDIDSLEWDNDADSDGVKDAWDGGADDDVVLKGEPFSAENTRAQAIGYGFDIGYPIIDNKAFRLTIFSEWNHLQFPSAGEEGTPFYRPEERSGDGFTVPGLRATLFNILNLSVEYRIKSGYFVPQFFDQSYDIARVVPVYSESGETEVETKDMRIFATEDSDVNLSGVYGSAGLDLLDILRFNASYASMVKDSLEYNSFFARLDLNPDLVPKLSEAGLYYQRNNDKNPFDFKNPSVNTIMGYRLGYEIASGVSLIWDFRQYYQDTGAGELEPVPQTTIETAFKL